MCFIKYHVSEDRSSIIELSGGVGTLRSGSADHEPAWHFDVKFVSGQGHGMTNVQKPTDNGHFLKMISSAYHSPYDLARNKVNAIYIVYKIRKYDSTGTDHNYHFYCRMGDNHRGICFLWDEKTMRVYGAVGDRKPDYMDISNFPTSYYKQWTNLVQETVYQIVSTHTVNTQHGQSNILSLQKADGSCCSAWSWGMHTKELLQNPMVMVNSRLFVRPKGSKTSKIGRVYNAGPIICKLFM